MNANSHERHTELLRTSLQEHFDLGVAALERPNPYVATARTQRARERPQMTRKEPTLRVHRPQTLGVDRHQVRGPVEARMHLEHAAAGVIHHARIARRGLELVAPLDQIFVPRLAELIAMVDRDGLGVLPVVVDVGEQLWCDAEG